MNRMEIFSSALLTAFVITVLWIMLAGQAECTESGGQYVRGMFWFECVR